MTDDADHASDYEECMRVRKPEPKPCGHCHNCGEHIKFGSFCDGYCAEDWEKRQRQKDVIDD
jgi:hypothetical protein